MFWIFITLIKHLILQCYVFVITNKFLEYRERVTLSYPRSRLPIGRTIGNVMPRYFFCLLRVYDPPTLIIYYDYIMILLLFSSNYVYNIIFNSYEVLL